MRRRGYGLGGETSVEDSQKEEDHPHSSNRTGAGWSSVKLPHRNVLAASEDHKKSILSLDNNRQELPKQVLPVIDLSDCSAV